MVLVENKKMQKNRFIKKSKKNKLIFGDCSLCCKNDGRIELIHISILKKKLKYFIKKKNKDISLIREKIWYFGRFNFYLQKKSKNSRMGKGKGIIERKVMRVRKNHTILEFKGISHIKILKLIKYLNKLFSVKLYLNTVKNHNFNLWSNNKRYLIFYKKYLY